MTEASTETNGSVDESLASAIPGLCDPAVGLSEVAVARREQILEAAEAIIAGHGIQKLSLAQIEQRAGMSRGQLTYYFPTKESILLAVFD
ncbi:MAG: TetR/AcrR family transcriptional regulator, partial [Gemmataceae bacterium]|nr:TetR/AcrR family transcriptional regulator [Gemmataceae bacterium]